METLYLIGRILYSLIFLSSGIGHLTNAQYMSQYAASKKVPAPKLAVIVTGLMILLGGLGVLLGIQTQIAAGLLVVFLIPTAFIMHRFWGLEDAAQAANSRIQFLKDLSLAGAALIIYFVEGSL